MIDRGIITAAEEEARTSTPYAHRTRQITSQQGGWVENRPAWTRVPKPQLNKVHMQPHRFPYGRMPPSPLNLHRRTGSGGKSSLRKSDPSLEVVRSSDSNLQSTAISPGRSGWPSHVKAFRPPVGAVNGLPRPQAPPVAGWHGRRNNAAPSSSSLQRAFVLHELLRPVLPHWYSDPRRLSACDPPCIRGSQVLTFR